MAPADAHRVVDLVPRLAAHPDVRTVTWRPGVRSLVLERRPGARVQEIVDDLPDARAQRRRGSAAIQQSTRWQWHQLLSPALALTAGVLGIAPVSAPAIAACAIPIARRALRSLSRRHVSIDVLDTAAATILIASGDLLAAGVSVALIETGERIRSRAAGQARHVLRGWIGGDARGVRVVREGSEPRVPTAEVTRGERAVVYAGETIPVDGVINAGVGLVDERAWTGEPLSRSVGPGDQVLAGSVVEDGRVVIDVTASGVDTRAGLLAAAIEDALAANTQVSDLARRIADRFVVPVLVSGGIVFAGTGDLARLASMLIVDFGTGIRVSVPTSILTTMVAAARQGVLFRNGPAVENLAGIDSVVFDKTGTLTSGRPTVSGVVPANGVSEDELLRLAASAEGHFPHPLARAVRRAARRRGLALSEPDTVSYRSGAGVLAQIDGRRVIVGGRSLLSDEGVDAPLLETTSSLVVMVAVDGVYAGRVRLQDRVRPDADRAVAALRRAGIDHIWLATGDRATAARRVTTRLQLDGFDARMMPEDKAELVRRMRAEGRRVAVVGDGINDAAAMAEANVAVAVAQGADLAQQTADVVLSSDNLQALLTAVELSRSAMSLVRQNVMVVTVPNAAALAMATVGRLTPLAATAVNNGSTLMAALNGLRPLRYRVRAASGSRRPTD